MAGFLYLFFYTMKPRVITKISDEDITRSLESFSGGRGHEERYASFDYCFNYFQQFRDKDDKSELAENMQYSCLHLGFYLASWGMYRGSTFLLQKSAKVFEDLIKYIASSECDVWDIDVHNYSTGGNISKLIACEKKIREKLGKHNLVKASGVAPVKEATLTLTTKIMLGVFGNVPAFDTYFKTASGLDVFNENSLKEIEKFYNDKKSIIAVSEVSKIETFDFYDYKKTVRPYTKAKIIDMIFFQKGLDESDTKRGKAKD